MRRHSPLAWFLAGSFALACGCESSSKQIHPDGAADARAVDRVSDAEAADGLPETATSKQPPDVGAADPPPDANAVSPSVDTALSTDASGPRLDADRASDGPLASIDVPMAADAPPVQSDTADPRDAARPEVTLIEGGTSPGDTRVAGAWVHVNKSAVNIGRLDVGATGWSSVIVANGGDASSGVLTIIPTAGIGVAGCNGTLAPMGTCGLTISVTPTSAGQFTGTVSISADPGATTPLLVTVSALVGAGPALFVQPSAIDLGTLTVGVPAPKQTVTVTAVEALSDLAVTTGGTATLSIDGGATTCEATLAAGASCTVSVDFTATNGGTNSAAVVISGGGTLLTVPITAVAQRPARLAVSPSTAAFASPLGGSSSAIHFTVANGGDVPTGALSALLSGPNATDFHVTNSCLALAPLATCTVSVTFSPSSTGGATRAATLTVTDMAAGGSSVSADLSGTLFNPPTLVITSPTSDLGVVVIGDTGSPTVFGVSNTGDIATGPLEVSVSSSELAIMADTCSAATLAPGAACTISIALRPTTVGAKSAILMVTDFSGHATAAKAITGAGLPSA
jgi:hypothetical protein